MTLFIILIILHIILSISISIYIEDDAGVCYFLLFGAIGAISFFVMSAELSKNPPISHTETVIVHTSDEGLEHTPNGFVFYEEDSAGIMIPKYVTDPSAKDITTCQKFKTIYENKDTWWKFDFNRGDTIEYFYPNDAKIIPKMSKDILGK